VLHILDGGNFVEGLFMLLSELFSFGAVIFMSSLRLSRFQLIKGRWFPVKMEFPFEYSSVIAPGLKNASSSSLKVRGPNYNAQIMHSFYGLVANLRPIRTDKSKFPGKVKSQIVDKVFLQENFPVYKTKIWLTESDDFQYYALFPKLHGSKLIGDSQSPVIGLAIWREAYDNESEAPMPASALDIMEWFAMTEIKPKEKQVQ
jgi:hypothetical protein